MANTREDICNLSQIQLGEKPNIVSIETPESDKETIYKTQYPVTRRALLRELKPSFAIKRSQVAQLNEIPLFGFNKVYEYPSDCIKLLGITTIDNAENNYVVEGNKIYTDEGLSNDEGISYFLEIRYIKDETSVSNFDDSFVKVLSLQLAIDVATAFKGSLELTNYLRSQITVAKGTLKALNSQENKPFRISRSKFLKSKFVDKPTWSDKR